jgi:hypothetical protein
VFFLNLKQLKTFKSPSTVLDRKPAQGYSPRDVETCHARLAETATRPRPGGLTQRGKRPVWPAATRARRARAGVVTTRRPRVGRRSGALADGSTMARRWQGVAEDLEGATGEVPGKEESRCALEWCADGEAAQTALGGGVAPVVIDERGEVLQLEGG